MGMVMADGSPVLQGRGRTLRGGLALAASVIVSLACGAATASADAGKVLVFTGTAGTPNEASATAASAIQAAGTAGDYTVDVTADKAQISAANLDNYRAVVFVNSAGDALDTAQEAALESYVQGGGGFVGIGETARLEEGSSNEWFNTLIGLTGASRTTDASAVSSQDVEFLDRVHPATRDLAALVKGRTDNYYQWTNNPTGLVHTVARVRFNKLPDGTSVTNDAVARLTGNNATIQPQLERALSWCRDVQQGRSFYTGMGQTVGAYDDALKKHIGAAVQWAAGMVRGNCKATINSNYSATRVTPANPAVPAQPVGPGTENFNPYMGEIDALSMASDGRVFYAGRAVCFQGQQQFTSWTHPQVGLGCGPIYVYDPRGAGSTDQNPERIKKIADFTVFGAKGGGPETGNTSKVEQGILGIALDPDFTNGRPYIYVAYHPYYGGEQGKSSGPSLGPGFVRPDYMGERRLSRFEYDETSKTLKAGSEKIIHRFMTQVFSCCHVGGSMDFDSEGNLYFATGDNTGNSPNSNNGGYTNSHPQYTVPCPGGDPAVYNGTGCGVDTSDPDGDGPGAPRTPCTATGVGSLAACGYISYSDARQTSGNTNAFEGKLLRIKPLANPGDSPGIGTTYTIPGADAPNGPNLFPPGSQGVEDGKAKPEIFAMGVRNLYSIDLDDDTDAISAAWVGPDTGRNSFIWGPAKTENAVMINSAGNYGWPFCTGNQQGYRAKLPANTGGGLPAPAGHPGTVAGPDPTAGSGGGGFWDCDAPGGIVNDSPYNTGLERIPPARPTNIWYGPQGGCYDFPRNENGIPNYNGTGSNQENPNPNFAVEPAMFRRCPFVIGGSQSPITGGTYHMPENAEAGAWPEYWEGRWFLGDFSSSNNVRHALLMDPETEFTGGQPISADSLLGIVPATVVANNSLIDWDFGADGSLYIASYGGGFFGIFGNTSIRRISYTGGDDTPGPDPQYVTSQNSSRVMFNAGRSGGIAYEWSFADGTKVSGPTATYTYLNGGTQKATLTVTYADGEKASKTIDVEVPTTVPTTVTADVPNVLGLTLGSAATFGTFMPGVAQNYTASTTANVVSTLPDAALSVRDPGTTNLGRMENAGTPLPQALRVRATNAASPNTAYATLTGSPSTLLSWTAPISNDAVTLQFQQAIAANDALKGGRYSKTLTFTLSTTQP